MEFFGQRGHALVPSSPVVPLDDPTLLFTNAGMNQFKPYFLGLAAPKHLRVANTQKCIRAGGKHNDLDDVGHDTYHHTFFEMLGNWSFGEYFKKEAIEWAWELLTSAWGIDPARLHATYFGGDQAENLQPDLQARDLWASVTDIDPSHIHAGGKKDNFWEMGETGPCGPCSEIHVDLTPDRSGGPLVNAGDPRVIEIWNLVFIQFNRGPDGRLTPLPARHVDTGMGLERVTAVLQGHNNNYATDLFVPIIQAIERISGHTYGQSHEATTPRSREGEPHRLASGKGSEEGRLPIRAGGVGVSPANRYARFIPGDLRDEACRVIADHIRCLTFAITDGAVPDKEGRGYVLRRILRRAVRFGWQYLDLRKPFLCHLVPVVVDVMGAAFPELKQNPHAVQNIIREEEECFERTLDRGIALFQEAADFARRRHHGQIRGEDAFKLHDTYGFPIDLTQIMARETGLTVDIAGYERLMEDARQRARVCGECLSESCLQQEKLAADRASEPTDDSLKYADPPECQTYFTSFATSSGRQAPDPAKPGEQIAFTVRQTCFYAEAGGQVGDVGELITDTGRACIGRVARYVARPCDQAPFEVIVHAGTVVEGQITGVGPCRLRVSDLRRATMKNHTATHVMNWALREVLGDHVQQKGSLVDPDKTRFDFSHSKPLSPDELRRVEELANRRIAEKLPVHAREVPQEQALKINGLRAVFGEKYPDLVRVVACGVKIEDLVADPDNPRWRNFPIELCGGTHVRNTGDIEHFVLVSEEAVAKGIRRIVAVTGSTARAVDQCGLELIARAQRLLQAPPEMVAAALAGLQREMAEKTIGICHRARLRDLVAQLQELVKRQQKAEAADAAELVKRHVAALLEPTATSEPPAGGKTVQTIGPTTVVVTEMPDVPIDQLKMAADLIKQKCGSAAVLLGVRVAPEAGEVAAGLGTGREAAPAAVTEPQPRRAGTVPERQRGPVRSEPDLPPSPGGDHDATSGTSRDRKGADTGGKALLLAAMTPDLVRRGLKAGELIKTIAPIIDGAGGGPPTMAQAGGKRPDKLPEALQAARNWIQRRLVGSTGP